MKIFIVDDSLVVRQRLRDMLSEIGETEILGEADSIGEALNMLKKVSPDLIVLDIRLKQGNGFDLLKMIKKNHQDLKVIMLTNYPYSQYKAYAMEIGADYFFDKSVDFEQLIKVIKELLKKDDLKK